MPTSPRTEQVPLVVVGHQEKFHLLLIVLKILARSSSSTSAVKTNGAFGAGIPWC